MAPMAHAADSRKLQDQPKCWPIQALSGTPRTSAVAVPSVTPESPAPRRAAGASAAASVNAVGT